MLTGVGCVSPSAMLTKKRTDRANVAAASADDGNLQKRDGDIRAAIPGLSQHEDDIMNTITETVSQAVVQKFAEKSNVHLQTCDKCDENGL